VASISRVGARERGGRGRAAGEGGGQREWEGGGDVPALPTPLPYTPGTAAPWGTPEATCSQHHSTHARASVNSQHAKGIFE